VEVLRGYAVVQTHGQHALTTDWTKQYTNEYRDNNNIVVQPTSTEAISAILKYCHQERLGVIPVSGNTGLVGGTMPMRPPPQQEENDSGSSSDNNNNTSMILLVLTKLDKIYGLQPFSGILHCQAGVILETLQHYAQDRHYRLPIDLGAKGTCCIGGNVATNAGGTYYYKYGSLAANIIGLQVVTANGDILELGSHGNRKDNTGYKLHQLFLGSEGTLGIITQVTIVCRPDLPDTETALVTFDNYDDVLTFTDQAKNRYLPDQLAAVEYMDGTIVDLVEQTHPGRTKPLHGIVPFPHYVLMETHSSSGRGGEAAMEEQQTGVEKETAFAQFIATMFDEQLIQQGVVAEDIGQRQALWNLRESCNPAAAQTGWTYKYDVSLPESAFGEFMETMKRHFLENNEGEEGPELVVTGWGHLLDGNLHFNVTTPGLFAMSTVVKNRIEPFVYEEVLRRGGSISAEHGIGQAKVGYMNLVHDSPTLALMRNIKTLFDPHGILNPGKVLPPPPTATADAV
jgi:FAD/FMN-containing dehydrogenase